MLLISCRSCTAGPAPLLLRAFKQIPAHFDKLTDYRRDYLPNRRFISLENEITKHVTALLLIGKFQCCEYLKCIGVLLSQIRCHFESINKLINSLIFWTANDAVKKLNLEYKFGSSKVNPSVDSIIVFNRALTTLG